MARGPITAPTSAEAELLLLQRQALLEEEQAKIKRALLTHFMQEKLSREEQSSLWGLHKVRTLWRSAQRKAKDQELRQDIEILSQTFARVMDCKDGTIEALVTELKEAEEQQNRALSSHLDLTDQLLQLQRCRLGYLEQGFSAQVGALKAEFEAERRAMLEQQDWESWVLQEMELATEQEHARSEQEALLNFQSARDDIKNKDMVTTTRGQIAAHLRKSEEQTQRIRGDREDAHQKLQKLRAQVTQASTTAHTHLVTLSSQCSATLKVLQQLVEKAQRLLRLAELCRRLETEEEKVLPFYPSSLGELEQQKVRRVLEETASEPLARVMKDYMGLERFWQRFNKAKLEEKGLERARAALADRNQELRKLLQQYLAGATMSQKVPKDPHPLLAIKQKPHPQK
ncbi:dynein regulatory complex subunit 2 [Geospiza fortis]|uniref:Dynein regulatory complex subunit 2 n=1 Tax=Geospiza fortis TaxID=48883 RepID=A0A8N5I4E7_GEOFO|nr:dynein regulatory complex subunit 2 [Geospiza fortis]